MLTFWCTGLKFSHFRLSEKDPVLMLHLHILCPKQNHIFYGLCRYMVTWKFAFNFEFFLYCFYTSVNSNFFNPIRPGFLRAPQAWGGIKLSHPCTFSSSNSVDLKFGMNIIYNEKVSKNFFCDYDVIIYDDASILIISSTGFWESTL